MTSLKNCIVQVGKEDLTFRGLQRVLLAMELVHAAEVQVDGFRGRLNFSAEIAILRTILSHVQGDGAPISDCESGNSDATTPVGKNRTHTAQHHRRDTFFGRRWLRLGAWLRDGGSYRI